MATLDTRDLVQQRLENLNDLARFEAEVGKAQAAGSLADAPDQTRPASTSRGRASSSSTTC